MLGVGFLPSRLGAWTRWVLSARLLPASYAVFREEAQLQTLSRRLLEVVPSPSSALLLAGVYQTRRQVSCPRRLLLSALEAVRRACVAAVQGTAPSRVAS